MALANGDRVKDKQRSRSSFVVDMEKKLAAENLLKELSSYHGALICQVPLLILLKLDMFLPLKWGKYLLLQDILYDVHLHIL